MIVYFKLQKMAYVAYSSAILDDALVAAGVYEEQHGETRRALEARMMDLQKEMDACVDALRRPEMLMRSALLFMGRLVQQVVYERMLVLFVRDDARDGSFMDVLLNHLGDGITEDMLDHECEAFRVLVKIAEDHMVGYDFSGTIVARGANEEMLRIGCSVVSPCSDEDVGGCAGCEDEIDVDFTFVEAPLQYQGVSTLFSRISMHEVVQRDGVLRNSTVSADGEVCTVFHFDFVGYVYRA